MAKNVAGFYAKGVFDKVVDIEDCWLQPSQQMLLRNSIADFARNKIFLFMILNSIPAGLRNMMVRIASTGEIMLNLVLGYKNNKNMKLLFDFILQSFLK